VPEQHIVMPRRGDEDETQLVSRARQKDNAAVRILIQQHNRRLYRIARSVVGNDSEAEDVVQEAYVRAFTNLAAFRGDSSLATWLSRIVLNEALGRIRRRRPTVEFTSIENQQLSHGQMTSFPLATMQLDPERIMAQREIQLILERAIDDLPDAFRTVLVARVIEEMSVEETAQLLGLRPETVRTRLNRARHLLRDAIEKNIGPALTDAFPFAGRRCERLTNNVLVRLSLPA
jgi:RNA polymerase sigma-70 factor, ECF subfamily